MIFCYYFQKLFIVWLPVSEWSWKELKPWLGFCPLLFPPPCSELIISLILQRRKHDINILILFLKSEKMEFSLLLGLSSHESCWETDMWTALATPVFWQPQRKRGFGQRSRQANKEGPKTESKAPAWGKNGAQLYKSIQGCSFKWSQTCHLV